MKPRKRTTWVLTGVLIASLAGCVMLLRPMDRVRASSAQEVLYLASPDVVKKLSFGYTGLIADIYWTRAVQYFGNRHRQGARSFELLYPLLNITTRLDPQLLVSYQFGSIFLSQKPPEGAGQPDKAVELVERGIAANPKEWMLYYNLGFIYYDMKAYEQASHAFARGAQVPGANPALAALAGMTAERGGGRDAARLLWTKLYESAEEDSIRNNALQHLVALRIADDIPQLEQAVRTFNERTGRMPTNFEEMVAAGWLRGVPQDPTGDPYLLESDGRVAVQHSEKHPYLQQALSNAPEASNAGAPPYPKP